MQKYYNSKLLCMCAGNRKCPDFQFCRLLNTTCEENITRDLVDEFSDRDYSRIVMSDDEIVEGDCKDLRVFYS